MSGHTPMLSRSPMPRFGLRTGSWERDIAANTIWADGFAAELLGIPARTLSPGSVANGLIERLLPEYRSEVQAKLTMAHATGAPYDVAYRIRDMDGGIRSVVGRGTTAFGTDGRPAKFVGIVIDVTPNETESTVTLPHLETVAANLMAARDSATQVGDLLLSEIIEMGLLHVAQESRS